MSFLGYNKGETLEFNYKKACGLWLIAVAFVIALAMVVGGEQIINMQVFSIGYMVSFFSINLNKKVLHKFSDGPSTPFQRKVSLYSVILLFVLLVLLGGPFFESENWRLIWLGALLATGIHFFPYYFVHGKSMIFLGLACVINALALVMHLVLNVFTGQALIPVLTSQFIFILLPIMYLVEDAKKNKESDNR